MKTTPADTELLETMLCRHGRELPLLGRHLLRLKAAADALGFEWPGQANIERAARDLGASEVKVLLLVTAPMMWPALFASFFLSMTFSWDEFVISFLLTRFETTLPVEIWNLLRAGLNPKTNAVGALVFGVSIILAIVFELVAFRKRPQ